MVTRCGAVSWIKRLLDGKVMGPRSRPGQAGSCDVRVTGSGFQAQPTPALLAPWFRLESWQGSWTHMRLMRTYRSQHKE